MGYVNQVIFLLFSRLRILQKIRLRKTVVALIFISVSVVVVDKQTDEEPCLILNVCNCFSFFV